MTLLITGGAGFIGSNFISYFLNKHQNTYIVNLDKLTYAGESANLEDVSSNKRYKFIQGDICDRNLLEKLFDQYSFEGVIHFAAESHVDNSIDSAYAFVNTNVLGSFTLLDVAKKYWMDDSNQIKLGFEKCRFHHISTDEVYGSLGTNGLFSEDSPYAPNSPYSASKASSDFIVRSYFKTYGMNVVTTNCSNNYGPNQHDEKLIPTIIRKALAGEKIPIYGNGENVRDWLYVLDHCKAIDLVFNKGKSGETYNIGGANEYTNYEVASIICDILDESFPKKKSYKEQISFVKDRLGHDFRYAVDISKIQTDLNWKADETFESGIKKTINWYLKKYKKS